MTLTAAHLAQARAAQESIMAATIQVRDYADGWTVVDGVDVPNRGEVVYEGKGRLQPADVGNGGVTAGRVPLTVTAYVGAVPWTVPLASGMTITVTDSDDPHIEGRVFRVVGVEYNALALTARRFTAELVADLRPQT